MKKMKAIISGILLAALVAACLASLPSLRLEAKAATVLSGTCGDNVSWTLDDAGTLTISGYGAMANYTSFRSAPWYDKSEFITSVVIEDGVTGIGDYAFDFCEALSSVTIPNSIKTIGECAFENCSNLAAISIPESVVSIGESAFYGCSSLTSIIIPKSVTMLGESVFEDCNSLTSVSIPKGVVSIGDYAFEGCSSLTSITIPNSVISISDSAFRECTGLTSLQVEEGNAVYHSSGNCIIETGDKRLLFGCNTSRIPTDGSVTSIEPYAFRGCRGLVSITIPGSVKSIDTRTFENCTSLNSVTIQEGVTGIGMFAFSNCTSLTGIIIPTTVTSIQDSAFRGCTGLTSIRVEEGNTVYCSAGNCIVATQSKTLIVGCQNSRIPTDGSVTIIGESAFYDCSSLVSITIPKSVTIIRESAFEHCSSLASVSIGEGVVCIGEYAFGDCINLTSVTIPDSVANIDEDAFYGCESLKEIYFDGSAPEIFDDAFADVMATAYYDPGATWTSSVMLDYGGEITWVARRKNSQGLTFSLSTDGTYYIVSGMDTCTDTDPVIPGTYNDLPVKEIGKDAFYNCEALTSITIPDSVETIRENAFSGCTALTEITIPGSVQSIASNAFYDCVGLEEIYFDGSAPSFVDDPFGSVTATAYYYPDSTWTSDVMQNHGGIITWASMKKTSQGLEFERSPDGTYYIVIDIGTCTDTEVVIPEIYKQLPVKEIGSNAFYNCETMISVTIPDSVTDIGEEAFDYCSSLVSVSIPQGVTRISDYAFSDCGALTTVTIPNSVTGIGRSAFEGCINLTSITIPNSVTGIGRSAFEDCVNLTSITIPNSVSSIEREAFYGCTGLTEIYFDGSAPTIGQYAFSDVTATAYYYPGDTWTGDVMQDYDGTITWVARDNSSQGLAYTLSADGTYYIVSGMGTCIDTDLVIPATYKGLPVKEIGASAFRDNTAITSVTIPEGVESIGNYAFSGCTGLTSLTLPNSLQTIGQSAFNKCSGLTSVSIPSNVESIGYHAFYNCPKLTYTVYGNAKYLGNAENPYLVLVQATSEAISSCAVHPDTRILYSEAFFCCTQLAELTVPKGVVELGPYLFDASGLKKVSFEGSAPSFSNNAFSGVIASAYYCPDSTWTEDVMQNYGGDITWKPLGSDVKLSVTSFGAAADPVTVQFIPSGETEAAYTLTTAASPANSGSWTLSDVKSGAYTVTLSKKNHVTRTYTLTVGDAEASLEAQLWLLGDVNGDGRVNYRDYGMALSQIKNPSAATLEGYALACADANGDGKANYIDYGMILAQAKGKSLLW